MIEKHTFKALINTIVEIESGIKKLEGALNCHFDQNWMTETPTKIIHTIAEGFIDRYRYENKKGPTEDSQINTIEELLYHFIYMEACGNDSEHCRSKLVTIEEGSDMRESISCTSLDELFGVIITYVSRRDLEFTFNYCHSHSLDDEELRSEN